MPKFFDKERYMVHSYLQLCWRLGLKLKIIHRILQFNQSQWLKQYVEFNTEQKIEAERKKDKGGKAF